jgi:hypothetical protein
MDVAIATPFTVEGLESGVRHILAIWGRTIGDVSAYRTIGIE